MHADLLDLAFSVAPGLWNIFQCDSCRCGFLDPRPTASTIGIAYTNYYTHEDTRGPSSDSPIARFRRGLASAYANKTFGTRFPGGIAMGHLFARLLPRLRRYLDVRYARHLPSPDTVGLRLLDVGCGNGEFLACASAMGWTSEGIDTDPVAVAVACRSGYIATLANINDPSLKCGTYSHITLSHVIEHVALPREQLTRCLDLLAPGGRLWLQTPNIDSLGHDVFGAAWRGLESPRHFVLFNRLALQKLLADIGFVDIQFKAHPGVPLFIWEESRQILKRMRPRQRAGFISWLKRLLPSAVIADYWSLVRPDCGEFLTCVAFRPRT